MLTYEDCVALCGLSDEEIAAIAEHEHVPEIVAASMAQYLVHMPSGERCIRRIIIDDIAQAKRHGDGGRADHLMLVLKHFVATHPHHGFE
jgi:hypothetical protein